MISVQSEHWVCFSCRKQFRKPYINLWPFVSPALRPTRPEYSCPECKTPMVDMGKYFRPPRSNDRQGWESMRRLAAHGYRFRSESSMAFLRYIGGTRLAKRDIEAALAYYVYKTDGERLLHKIDQKKKVRRSNARR
jgi:hypothetical protein